MKELFWRLQKMMKSLKALQQYIYIYIYTGICRNRREENTKDNILVENYTLVRKSESFSGSQKIANKIENIKIEDSFKRCVHAYL
jgi:hypothetical protein